MENAPIQKTFITTKQLTLIGVMTAVTCILGPFTIPLPFSPVPISFTNLAVYLTVYVLGMKFGTISFITYLLLGAVGLPVFSAFTGGIGKLAGPTGGYLIGFIFLALIAGFFIDRFAARLPYALLGMVLGTLVCYFFGTTWLAHQMNLDFPAALAAGVIPYLPGDLVKIIIATLLGPKLRAATLRQ
ncbi:biotin transporter BioY [Faecalicatena contorta]|uniref:biotin transporter BioY n=1 Tax=Faecalicatena contorta TaxID=39482 RepID=UPI002EAFFA01|nr:biotin transporter BioY [Muricomes sp.]